MNKKKEENKMMELKPFISVIIIISTLFAIVFVKMENRRLGYVFWKNSKKEKILKEKEKRIKVLFAKRMDPRKLHDYAKKKMDLRRADFGQIIHMTRTKSGRIALRQ